MSPLVPGARLGNYEILAPIGAGGMGEVYRARDLRLERDVALKVLPSGVADDAERLARFEREARTVAGFNHPNIVTLHSVEDADGVRFLTMELVDGETLDRHVVPGGLPAARVMELGIALAEALAAAHEKSVVHRDLKPSNVMLTRDGRVKVLDFGLAKLEATDEGILTTQSPTMEGAHTSAGQVVGTLPYMAPEQVRGETVDARTDLFALGVVLYELSTGRRPFPGNTIGMVSSAILRDTPSSITTLRPDLPAGLARIVARCLEKNPRERFQRAVEVRDALNGVGPTVDAGAILKLPPTPSTALLGREALLESAAVRLRAGVRVLTVTGYGGTGKTRFAIEMFRRLAPEFPGGAAFVSLASVTQASEVLPTIVVALDIAEAEGRSSLEALVTVIGDRRMLLVLDNLEQVLDAAEDIAALVARCPELTILATSRAPLKIGAESEFSLPPLELPAADASSPDAVGGCASVALFLQRAEKVKPGFGLTEANAPAIAAICRRLDGLPLALELAAARVRILEPAALLQRLDHALDLLTSGDRDLPIRQRTLRATISWSYSLLGAAEQSLLRRLSVFHEGWTLEAMERVCYAPEESHRALDELDSLVEKGLVRVVGSGDRYALLETVRAFAAEQLHAEGRVEAAREAHADWFLEMAGAVAAGIRTPAQLEALGRARADYANTMAAVNWLVTRARNGVEDAVERALLLCGYMDWVWHIGALHYTARVNLDPMLALARNRPPSRGRALSWVAAGMVATTTGEWERSLEEWTNGLEDGRAIGDNEVAAEGMMGVGYCNLSLGRLAEAAAALDEAIAMSSNGVSDFMLALSLSVRGMLHFATGDVDGGIATVERGRRICEANGDHEIGGVALSFLAQMQFARGEHATALSLYHEALASLEAVGDYPEVARVHSEMGWTALATGDLNAAQRAFVRAVRTNELVGSPRGTGLAIYGLAAVEAAAGRPERAVTMAAAAEALSARAGVVIAHPMDPGFAARIEALKATIPRGRLDGIVADAGELSPGAVLAMVTES